MSTVINFIDKNKKVLIPILIVISLPLIMPLLEVVGKCLFYTGKYAGTWVRMVMNGINC